MSNRFFNRIFNAQEGTFALAAGVRNEYERVATGFALVQAELDLLRPIWLPSLLGLPRQILATNDTATAAVWVHPGRVPVLQVLAARALAASDSGKNLLCTSASAMALTVPDNGSVPIDVETAIIVTQCGAGKVTLTPGTGVLLRAADSLVATRTQYSQITLLKIATNEWVVGGDRD